MKKIVILFLLVFLFVIPSTSFAQKMKTYTNQELLKMNVIQILKVLKIPTQYRSRYENIILPLCKQGVIIFDGKLKPYWSSSGEKILKPIFKHCYRYIGTPRQNQRFVRNIVKNRFLFKNGKLIPGAAKRWIVVR